MPLKISKKLPAVEALKNENIFVMDSERAESQEIRPLKILIINLMPLKVSTETDLIRLLSNTPLQMEVDFLRMTSHTPKNTSIEHMMQFYKSFDEVKKSKYDGMIVTGAPIEHLPFEEVKYWKELQGIFDWGRTNVTSTFFICWAAQAGLYHYYGIPKYPLDEKIFGVFEHTVYDRLNPLFRGFDDVFYVPQSRHTEIRKEDILKVPELNLLSESPISGVYLVMARGGREIFITGHSEYSPYTLDSEYKRDLKKGLPIKLPQNYYLNDDPKNQPVVRWRSHANLLFSNWLNYFVYQETPYDLSKIG
ncbi:MAG: homoserine O-succinyltransferase [Porphyromonadaceae bacterium]|jgi:homoserine O-succinyltransferase|nr:homoserine O-succinyltransferase [Porphyromonadaceae bacterium]